VDKNQFINVLHHFGDSSVEEAEEILSLKADFPFSQMLHALSARVSKDHGFSTQQQELQLAAVYASDRSVLKDIMTKSFNDLGDPAYSLSVSSEKKTVTEKLPEVEEVSPNPFRGDLADEVIHDLDKLHELRHNFEMLFIDLQKSPSELKVNDTEVKGKPAESEKREQFKESATRIPADSKNESSKSKKARIVAMAKNLSSKGKDGMDDSAKTHKKKDHPVDAIIEEIKTTKRELKPSGEKQKEQQEIIEKFIKTQPTITNSKEKIAATPVGDLSSIKSGEFSDNIVSETLVDLLISQGKKDKAIEVLKKLIWKFPQKKVYFAAQIEELKK
jgi:hypothetical protein